MEGELEKKKRENGVSWREKRFKENKKYSIELGSVCMEGNKLKLEGKLKIWKL